MRIDLNVDVGEGFPFDEALLESATSANVCCGAHAGSSALSKDTVALCHRHGVIFGAHPGIPDRESMGRGPWRADVDLTDELYRQVQLLLDLGAQYVKPHGTLYNRAATDPGAADMLYKVVLRCKVPLLGLKGTLHEDVARQAGVRFVAEGFVDRRTDADGLLLDRSLPGAVIKSKEEALDNASHLASHCGTLCVHGDTEGCVELLRAVKERLIRDGFEVRPWL